MQNTVSDSQIERLASAQNQAEYDSASEGAQGASPVPLAAVVQQREDWAAAAQFYWGKAYFALCQRDYRLMRLVAAQAQGADKAASLDGAVLGAIFGVAPACADTQAIAQGRGLPKADVDAARKAVLGEVQKHFAQQAAAKAAQRAAENAAYAAKKAADKAAWDAAAPQRKAAADKAAAEKAAAAQVAATQAAASSAAIASEKVRAIVAQQEGTTGTTADVMAVAHEAASCLGALGVKVTTLRAAPGAWAKLKMLVGAQSVTILVDELRQEPDCLRRARRVAEHVAAGAVLVDGVILTDDGQEIDVTTL